MADLYEELGLPRDASPAAIKAAKRRVAKEHHPDKPGGNEETFKRKMQAVTILSDPHSRAHYDRTGDEGGQGSGLDNPIRPLIIQAFDAALQANLDILEFADLAEEMRDYLLEKAKEGEAQNAAISGSIEKLKIAQERMSFNGEGEDFIAASLASKLQQSERNLAANAELIERFRAAAGYAAAYRYRIDERPSRERTSWDDLSVIIERSGGRPYAPFHEFGREPGRKR